MELLNGTENPIRGLDKNVWEYCIMENIIETLTTRLKQIIVSYDDFNTKLDTISSIQTEFYSSLSFYDKFINTKSIKRFNDAVKDTKIQIIEKEIDELNKLLNTYDTKCATVVKMYAQNICSEIEEINQQLTIIESIKTEFISKYKKIEEEFLNKRNTNIINLEELGRKFEIYQDILKIQTLEFENKCKKKKYIIEHPGSEFVIINSERDFDKTSNYYTYNLDNNIELTKLGKFEKTELDRIYTNNRTSNNIANYYIFNNNGKEMIVNSNQKEFLKENDSTGGGKPKKSRRHKNKKRRSSRRKN